MQVIVAHCWSWHMGWISQEHESFRSFRTWTSRSGGTTVLHVQRDHSALMIWALFLPLLPGRWCQATLLELASQRQTETVCCFPSGCQMASAVEDWASCKTSQHSQRWLSWVGNMILKATEYLLWQIIFKNHSCVCELGLPALTLPVFLLLLKKNVDCDFPWTYKDIIVISRQLKHYTN